MEVKWKRESKINMKSIGYEENYDFISLGFVYEKEGDYPWKYIKIPIDKDMKIKMNEIFQFIRKKLENGEIQSD